MVQDKISEVASGLISAYDSGELTQALGEGRDGWQKWVKGFGKSTKRKVCCDPITSSFLFCCAFDFLNTDPWFHLHVTYLTAK